MKMSFTLARQTIFVIGYLHIFMNIRIVKVCPDVVEIRKLDYKQKAYKIKGITNNNTREI